MGSAFGFVFGLFDLEDVSLHHLRKALSEEQRICFPIGAFLGAASTVLNDRIRTREVKHRFQPLDVNDPFEEDLQDL